MDAESGQTRFVKEVFAEVPATYERVNHVLTFGLDILWRRRAARVAAAGGGTRWVDMCTGTGETAVYLQRLAPEGTTVQAVDFSPAMMEVARKKRDAKEIEFIEGDIHALPFADGSIDVITMSFATRNVNVSREALVGAFAELYRVLKPGGRFVNLETSQPRSAIIRRLFHLHIRLFVKQIGSRLSGARAAYAYLARTIPRFYGADELVDILHEAGFSSVDCRQMLMGAAAIHTAHKE